MLRDISPPDDALLGWAKPSDLILILLPVLDCVVVGQQFLARLELRRNVNYSLGLICCYLRWALSTICTFKS